ncbi:MAG: SUMF1/EgtB/PvdO family nonheme iron enzyme [Pseudomonadota bacterium]
MRSRPGVASPATRPPEPSRRQRRTPSSYSRLASGTSTASSPQPALATGRTISSGGSGQGARCQSRVAPISPQHAVQPRPKTVAKPLLVSGGTYNRSNNFSYPATVSDFLLDRFEITVGRFRRFVEAGMGTKANPPAAGAGAHPLIAGSGWDAAWNTNLPADTAALKTAVKCSSTYQTWTDTAGANESLPQNCLNWYDLFAFCAWDGGRLPTEAEWNYAAAGGSEQRTYPWGSAAPDGTYAVYHCMGDGSAAGSCAFTDILVVGSRSSKGDARWGQSDLAGSMWEWTLDWYNSTYPTPCVDCANLVPAIYRSIRGGSFDYLGVDYLASSYRSYYTPAPRGSSFGGRCARTP